MTIIGLTGYAQNGKDTAGARLVSEHGFTRFAFADALKSMALVLNPHVSIITERYRINEIRSCEFMDGLDFVRLAWLVDHFGWETSKRIDDVRRFLQVLGTEGVRDHLGENSWVDALYLSIAKSGAVDTVITDVRFPNEAAWVKRMGGVMVRVIRMNEDGTEFDNGLGKDHPSEALIDSLPVDLQIQATSVEQLESILDRFMDPANGWVTPGVTTG